MINFKIFLESTSKAVADGEKSGEDENKKFEYLNNKKSFLDQIKIK